MKNQLRGIAKSNSEAVSSVGEYQVSNIEQRMMKSGDVDAMSCLALVFSYGVRWIVCYLLSGLELLIESRYEDKTFVCIQKECSFSITTAMLLINTVAWKKSHFMSHYAH
ncbi:MAG: hypothetical protein GWN67_10875 [Phycisphaerae bacterium]|nr:hypothetical protein [Phycisphaerae bacterium]NIP52197.1 hypothetical protein [Phycisphaerae bacterium]NIS51608.1 hypothetical protein [Phycisphaerae bacterium]NIU09199.1 hypothetical protein [Phycisphaerae bacterium]NIU56860.1 hypothetical protein [Phycisphaerae bacterium]